MVKIVSEDAIGEGYKLPIVNCPLGSLGEVIAALSKIVENRINEEDSTDVLEINYTYVHVYVYVYVRVIRDELN